ncbi:MAG TPA: fibronectin type III domain-containing protein, partial [Paludibacter sp.]
VKPGSNRGSVVVSCDVVANASFYVIEYTEGPVTADSIWIQKTTTKHKLLIEGLTSGKQYTFRVAGAGSDPSRVWSDDVSSFVL